MDSSTMAMEVGCERGGEGREVGRGGGEEKGKESKGREGKGVGVREMKRKKGER